MATAIEKHIDMLRLIALDSEPFSNARVAAMIVYKNRVISIGTNSSKSHPFAERFKKKHGAIYLHAETAAILKAIRILGEENLKRATIIVARVKGMTNQTGMLFGIAKPCGGCSKCIEEYGIRKVIYTEDCSREGELRYVTELR